MRNRGSPNIWLPYTIVQVTNKVVNQIQVYAVPHD